jgi:hypothetical protein
MIFFNQSSESLLDDAVQETFNYSDVGDGRANLPFEVAINDGETDAKGIRFEGSLKEMDLETTRTGTAAPVMIPGMCRKQLPEPFRNGTSTSLTLAYVMVTSCPCGPKICLGSFCWTRYRSTVRDRFRFKRSLYHTALLHLVAGLMRAFGRVSVRSRLSGRRMAGSG